MLILAFVSALLHLASSTPTTDTLPDDVLSAPGPTIPLTILGHELPKCLNPAQYRTMQGIVWSCLATIFACTWVSMHPNVPDPRFSGYQRLREHVILMIYALLVPELVAVWAFVQRMRAVKRAQEYNELFKLKEPPSRSVFWYTKEWFYASSDRKCQKFHPAWTLTHGFLFEMQGLVFFRDGYPSHSNWRPDWRDDINEWGIAGMFEKVGREEVIYCPLQMDKSFSISEEEINDKSKGDAFTKLVVILQTTWFIVQCIARWASHLYVTELVIVTLAFASVNIVIYILWWNKPQNMGTAIRIHEKTVPPPQRPDALEHRTLDNNNETTPSVKNGTTATLDPSMINSIRLAFAREKWPWKNISFERIIKSVLREIVKFLFSLAAMLGLAWSRDQNAKGAVRCFTSHKDGTWNRQVALMVGMIGALFGGVHLILFWSSSFPSARQRYLWLASSLFITVEPVVAACAVQIMRVLGDVTGAILFLLPHTIGLFLYIACRVILFLLAFDNLRYLPPDAFLNVEWSTFFPHI